MTTELAEYKLLPTLQYSELVDSVGKSKTWFGLLNLRDYPADKFPDAGQIADYIFAENAQLFNITKNVIYNLSCLWQLICRIIKKTK